MEISVRDAAALLKSDPRAKLIDVRTNQEWETARIPGAVLVNTEEAVETLLSLPKDTPIVVHCHHGIRSLQATAYFLELGFQNVRSMAGGIDAWSQEIDPGVPRY